MHPAWTVWGSSVDGLGPLDIGDADWIEPAEPLVPTPGSWPRSALLVDPRLGLACPPLISVADLAVGNVTVADISWLRPALSTDSPPPSTLSPDRARSPGDRSRFLMPLLSRFCQPGRHSGALGAGGAHLGGAGNATLHVNSQRRVGPVCPIRIARLLKKWFGLGRPSVSKEKLR